MKAFLAQTKTEISLILNGESILLAVGIPIILLVGLSIFHLFPISFVVPGIISLALMSTAMTNLAILTSFERSYGFLKRLGATPLGRPSLLGAKTLSVVVVEIIQIIVIMAIGIALGWNPHIDPISVILATLLSIIAFTGLGFLLAGTMSQYLVLSIANGLYVILALLSDMVFPIKSLPSLFRNILSFLPSTALANAFHDSLSYGRSVPSSIWLILIVWAIILPFLAAKTFKWE